MRIRSKISIEPFTLPSSEAADFSTAADMLDATLAGGPDAIPARGRTLCGGVRRQSPYRRRNGPRKDPAGNTPPFPSITAVGLFPLHAEAPVEMHPERTHWGNRAPPALSALAAPARPSRSPQAIAVSCIYRENWPLLVIAPSALRLSWRQVSLCPSVPSNCSSFPPPFLPPPSLPCSPPPPPPTSRALLSLSLSLFLSLSLSLSLSPSPSPSPSLPQSPSFSQIKKLDGRRDFSALEPGTCSRGHA